MASAAHYLANAEAIKKRAAQRYKDNPEAVKQRTARYRKANAGLVSKRRAEASREIRMAVLAHYGLVCSSCSESRIGALQIDHINGGGRQQLSNADTIALYLHQQFRETGAYPLGYQTLCANCNTKKHAIGITPPSTPNAIRNKRYRDRVKRTFMDLLGARCACGQSDMDVLTAGHPNGDGADHRREVSDGKAGFFFYHALLKSPDLTGRTIICQCFSCNCDEAYG